MHAPRLSARVDSGLPGGGPAFGFSPAGSACQARSRVGALCPMCSVTESSLVERLDRVESELELAIRSLAASYALAVDGRDLDTLVGLFAGDVDCGRRGSGRAVLREFFAEALRGFYRSAHLVCGHVIDLAPGTPETATGVVACRAEHEVRDRWVVQTFCYFDRYERRRGDGTLATVRQGGGTPRTSTADLGARRSAAGTAPPGRLEAFGQSWTAFWAEADAGAVTAFRVT
jgi:hypothetical protein